MAEETDSNPVQYRFKSDVSYMVTTSGGVPQKHGTQTDFTSGIPVGNKGQKGGKGKSKTPTQPKKVTPKKKK